METAALKASSDNRNKVFVRKVTAVYTPATLEAGTEEDVGGEGAAVAQGEPTLDPLASCYMMALCESDASSGRGVHLCQTPGDLFLPASLTLHLTHVTSDHVLQITFSCSCVPKQRLALERV
jgi:hypothetical protein